MEQFPPIDRELVSKTGEADPEIAQKIEKAEGALEASLTRHQELVSSIDTKASSLPEGEEKEIIREGLHQIREEVEEVFLKASALSGIIGMMGFVMTTSISTSQWVHHGDLLTEVGKAGFTVGLALLALSKTVSWLSKNSSKKQTA